MTKCKGQENTKKDTPTSKWPITHIIRNDPEGTTIIWPKSLLKLVRGGGYDSTSKEVLEKSNELMNAGAAGNIGFIKIPDLKSINKTVDLLQWLPEKLNQGNEINSCVPLSIASSLTIQINRANKKLQYQVSPSPLFVYGAKEHIGENNSLELCKLRGMAFEDVHIALHDKRGNMLNEWPFDSTCEYLKEKDIKYKGKVLLSNYTNLNIQVDDRHNDFRERLLQEKPPPINILIPYEQNYEKTGRWHINNNTLNKCTDYYADLHAMLIVGFDDTKQAFKVLDSRGSDWGDGGCIWITYSLMDDLKFLKQATIFSYYGTYTESRGTIQAGSAKGGSSKEEQNNLKPLKNYYWYLGENRYTNIPDLGVRVSLLQIDNSDKEATFLFQFTDTETEQIVSDEPIYRIPIIKDITKPKIIYIQKKGYIYITPTKSKSTKWVGFSIFYKINTEEK